LVEVRRWPVGRTGAAASERYPTVRGRDRAGLSRQDRASPPHLAPFTHPWDDRAGPSCTCTGFPR